MDNSSNMNNSTDSAIPGPSNVNASKSASSEKIKKITFAPGSSPPSTDQPTDSFNRRRRSSLVGTAGFVSQLVEELEEDESEEPFKEEPIKPIRKQSIEERRKSIKEVGTDIGYYMKSVARMSIANDIKSSEKLLTTSKEKIKDIKSLSKTKIADSSSSTELLPSKILDPQTGEKMELSWVGSYIVGKDYWEPHEKDEREKEFTKDDYAMGEEKKQWYEISSLKTSFTEETAFSKLKMKSIEKIGALKDEMDREFHLQRKQRLISAAHAREKPKELDEWTDSFKASFQVIAKANKLSHHGTHMMMADADKWLEKADIVDHVKLTLIHTGFCFLASGGSRNRGLSFTEFTHFLQMISHTIGMPVRDITRRLETCLRKIPDKEK